MDFLRLMFQQINSRHVPEPDVYSLNSIQGAVYALQKSSGMSRTYLGKRLGLTKTQMVNLESRGKPVNRALLERLQTISTEYTLYRLAEYFTNQILLIQNRQRDKMRKQTTGQ